jgi:hypothetical protein
MYGSADHSNNSRQGHILIQPILLYCDSMKLILKSLPFHQLAESKVFKSNP